MGYEYWKYRALWPRGKKEVVPVNISFFPADHSSLKTDGEKKDEKLDLNAIA